MDKELRGGNAGKKGVTGWRDAKEEKIGTTIVAQSLKYMF